MRKTMKFGEERGRASSAFFDSTVQYGYSNNCVLLFRRYFTVCERIKKSCRVEWPRFCPANVAEGGEGWIDENATLKTRHERIVKTKKQRPKCTHTHTHAQIHSTRKPIDRYGVGRGNRTCPSMTYVHAATPNPWECAELLL